MIPILSKICLQAQSVPPRKRTAHRYPLVVLERCHTAYQILASLRIVRSTYSLMIYRRSISVSASRRSEQTDLVNLRQSGVDETVATCKLFIPIQLHCNTHFEDQQLTTPPIGLFILSCLSATNLQG